MEPALREGDWLFVLPPRPAPRSGDVVLVRDPLDPSAYVLKRIADVTRDGVFLAGDHAADSLDSRHYGAVPLADVVGRAAFRYAPRERIGVLRHG